MDSGILETNPVAHVKLPRIEHHEMRFLTPAEVADLAQGTNPADAAIVRATSTREPDAAVAEDEERHPRKGA